MSGHFFAFKNREKISEAKKLSLKETLRNKKSNLIRYNSFTNEKHVEHSKISKNELDKIKQQIKKLLNLEKRKKT